MDNERNLGVTEARFALTLLTCLLVAIGYIVLLRLGGAKEMTVEPAADDVTLDVPDPPNTHARERQPRVLPLETAKRAAPPNSPVNPERR